MFAIRHRNRPRRSARFVPTVDGLQSRIAPSAAANYIDPIDYEICEPVESSEPVAPTSGQPNHQMRVTLNQFYEECKSTGIEI